MDAVTQLPVSRKYFSGGLRVFGKNPAQLIVRVSKLSSGDAPLKDGDLALVTEQVAGKSQAAMITGSYVTVGLTVEEIGLEIAQIKEQLDTLAAGETPSAILQSRLNELKMYLPALTAEDPINTFIKQQTDKLEMFLATGQVKWNKEKEPKPEKYKASIQVVREKLAALFENIANWNIDKTDEGRIRLAVVMLIENQGRNTRRPGDSYAIHPIEVALDFVTSLNIKDPENVISALLHDFIEDVKKFKAPGVLGDVVGAESRDQVAALTNKDLSEEAAKWLKRQIEIAIGFDGSVPMIEARDAIFTILEYQLGIVRKVTASSTTMLLKSRDFANNAGTLDEMSDPLNRARLSAKYGELVSVFAQEFVKAAEAEEHRATLAHRPLNDLFMASMAREKAEYLAWLPKLIGDESMPGFACSWPHWALFQKTFQQLAGAGGLTGLLKKIDALFPADSVADRVVILPRDQKPSWAVHQLRQAERSFSKKHRIEYILYNSLYNMVFR